MESLAGFEHILCQNEPLAPYTYLRIGGPAEYLAEPTSIDELAALVRRCREAELPVRILGGGSNLLVRDQGVPGVVIRLAAPAFAEIRVEGNEITVGAGAQLGHTISSAVREGLAGLEQLVGIPGSIGGALRNNSGTENHDIGQCTRSATMMTRDGEILTRDASELQFAYRYSNLDELLILGARLELEPDERRELTKRMQTLWIVKKSRQPPSGENAGRIFKDPGGLRAAEMIEQAGLKGTKVGNAEICERHGNYITVAAGTTSDEVLRLIDLVQTQVQERVGVELEVDMKVW
jgi:UDP-N-acetylmuramate dehydrogenase